MTNENTLEKSVTMSNIQLFRERVKYVIDAKLIKFEEDLAKGNPSVNPSTGYIVIPEQTGYKHPYLANPLSFANAQTRDALKVTRILEY